MSGLAAPVADDALARRNTLLLAAAQALYSCGITTIFVTGSLIGLQLAPSEALATMPITALVFGTALATIPASMLGARVGRRTAFLAGATRQIRPDVYPDPPGMLGGLGAGRVQDLVASPLGLYAWSVQHQYGGGPKPITLLDTTGGLEHVLDWLGVSHDKERHLNSHRQRARWPYHPPDDYRDLYTDEMLRWVEDADEPLIRLMGYTDLFGPATFPVVGWGGHWSLPREAAA